MKPTLVVSLALAMCAIGAAQDPLALPPSPYVYTVSGPGGAASIEIADTSQPVYFELQAENAGYSYGNVTLLYPHSAAVVSVEALSVEEDFNGEIWCWWTPASAEPEYSGSGSLFSYSADVGSGWSQQWAQWGEQYGFTPGPVASIEPNYYQNLSDGNKAALQQVLGTTDETVLNSYGAIRFYLSSMVGPGTSPLRIGALVNGAAGTQQTLPFVVFTNMKEEYDWSPASFHTRDDSAVTVSFPAPAPATPEEMTQKLKNTILDSFANGYITKMGVATSLTAKLDEILTKIDNGDTVDAIHQLNAFENQVWAQAGEGPGSSISFNAAYLLSLKVDNIIFALAQAAPAPVPWTLAVGGRTDTMGMNEKCEGVSAATSRGTFTLYQIVYSFFYSAPKTWSDDGTEWWISYETVEQFKKDYPLVVTTKDVLPAAQPLVTDLLTSFRIIGDQSANKRIGDDANSKWHCIYPIPQPNGEGGLNGKTILDGNWVNLYMINPPGEIIGALLTADYGYRWHLLQTSLNLLLLEGKGKVIDPKSGEGHSNLPIKIQVKVKGQFTPAAPGAAPLPLVEAERTDSF